MEKALHYWWKYRMAGGGGLRLVDGREVRIINPGLSNTDAGPDFSNACVTIDGTTWVGNVEIHIKASDWKAHHHDSDPAYDNIILHVVAVNDYTVHRSDGSAVPQLLVLMPDDYLRRFAYFTSDLHTMRCSDRLPSLPRIAVVSWVERMGLERLQSKAQHVKEIYEASGFDWYQTCFCMLARALGFGLNAEPFEMLARNTPLAFLRRHSDDIVKIEAMIFGQAGMLGEMAGDAYYNRLVGEYRFLMHKYSLRPMAGHLWKSARTRPGNFPQRRLAMLAAAVAQGFPIADVVLKAVDNPGSVRQSLVFDVSEYWTEHSSFGSRSEKHVSGRLSTANINLLLINFVAPVVYAHAVMRNRPEEGDVALDLLASLPAENNMIIRRWESYGVKPDNAMQSQALLHITKNYCNEGKCLYCHAGHAVLRRSR